VNDQDSFVMDTDLNTVGFSIPIIASELPIVDTPVSLTVTEPKNDSFEYYKDLLFNKYSYRRFNFSESRTFLFASKKRPVLEDWNSFKQYLSINNFTSEIKVSNQLQCLRFNLQSVLTKKFQNYQFVKKIITRTLEKLDSKQSTAFFLHHKFNYLNRPSNDSFKLYLSCLVSDGELIAATGNSDTELYKLK
jgi:hypothetical protein